MGCCQDDDDEVVWTWGDLFLALAIAVVLGTAFWFGVLKAILG